MTDGVRILLVEDNPHDLELALYAFRQHNLANDVRVARDGEEALEYLLARGEHEGREPHDDPQVILLDLKLPKVEGIEVLRSIKQHERTRNIPVVVLTSSAAESDLFETYNLGVNSYIVKPVDFDQFTDAVKLIGFYWLLLNKTPDVVAAARPR